MGKPARVGPAALLGILAALGWAVPARGADAAFCGDGSAVFRVTDRPNTLERICDEEGSLTSVEIGLGGRKGCFTGITPSDQGGFYLTTPHGVWHWKPGRKKAESIHRAPENVRFLDIACDTKSGRLLVMASGEVPDEAGNGRLFCMTNRNAPLAPVWLRHLSKPVDCAVFLPDHTLLFGTEGDLWHGVLCIDSPDRDFPDGRGELVSYRYAPLAERFNYNGTSEERGVRAVAVSAGKAYVGMHRIGGSGEATFLRLDLPGGGPDRMFSMPLKNTAKDAAAALQSVEEFDGSEGDCRDLCGSADGRLVYYTDSSTGKWRHRLCEDDGEPVPMKIE